jgi:membrane protein implicated in regulation of membrane protease activity
VQQRLSSIFGDVPGWALAAGAVLVLVVVALGFWNSFFVGLALLIIAALAVVAFLAWTRLPERYEEGPDKAERAELERRRRQEEEYEEEEGGNG